jgi:site-specific recombinase XerD
MPATQRGHARKLPSGKWQLRYYDADGNRRTGGSFPTKTAALDHYRHAIEPALNGVAVTQPDVTLSVFVETYLDRHAATRRPRTIKTLRERLARATEAYGEIHLRELERMSGEIADWHAKLPERSRYGIMQALRQALEAAVRWELMSRNPAKLAGRNPQPPPRPIRVFDLAELDAIAVEMSPAYRPLPRFVASTGMRPEEWAVVERRDVDRRAGHVNVARTLSDGQVVELGKTSRSRRQIPLTRRALAALDEIPARLDTPLLFPAPEGGPISNSNWHRREWQPAVEASGVTRPARPYDLRSTFASNALAANVSIFQLGRIMGSSTLMIERHYGCLLDGAGAAIVGRLDAHETHLEAEASEALP